MKLKQIDIEAYRSIRARLTMFVESNVTVVLGPNDHGKTNLLNAIRHLNADLPFNEDDDLNWDSSRNADKLPLVSGVFSLSDKERNWLLQNENEARTALNRQIEEARLRANEEAEEETDAGLADSVQPVSEGPTVVAKSTPAHPPPPHAAYNDEEEEEEEEEEDLPEEPLANLVEKDVPAEITIRRIGTKGELEVTGLESFQVSVQQKFRRFFPRAELINPITNLSDSVSAGDLAKGKNEFMRGIFYYAGLTPDDSQDLFDQTDRTQMTITRASDSLNTTLRQSWSQGQDLRFRLSHNSKHEQIELQIEDPSVTSTYVRASRRSSGFTHYFSLKTILHARQQDHPADSYILLFDEPGVFLHPSGQFDLLQVLETLSMESQIVYVTHSLFMINKTFPTRHRLIMKNDRGTILDAKPYVGRWQSVLSALGLTLTGSILFANHVVLTEGDSDPIYIYAILQKSVSSGKGHLDINGLAVMSTVESRHADVLIRLLCETQPAPKIAMIIDGDKGGKDRLKYVVPLLKKFGIPEKTLPKDTTIEDHIPMVREVYVPAVAAFVGKLMVLDGKAKPDEGDLAQKFLDDFDGKFMANKVTVGVADWASSAAQEVGGIDSAPSKVGIAREYAVRLLEFSDKQFIFDGRPKALIEWIRENVGLPELAPSDKTILRR